MSNLLLVNDALSLIAVLPEGQNASAEQGELVLRVATDMIEEWADEGIYVSWPAAPQMSDACGLSGTERTAVVHALAVRLCPHFERNPSPALASLSLTTFQRLARQQMLRAMQPIYAALPRPEGAPNTDSFEADE